MKDELIEEYSKLSITEKRNILINDMVLLKQFRRFVL